MNNNDEIKNKTNNQSRSPIGGGRARLGEGVEKPKDFKKGFKYLLSNFKPYRVFIIIALILAIASAVFSLIGPGQLEDITNYIVEGLTSEVNITEIQSIAIFLVIIYSLSLIFGYIQSNIIATISQKIARSLRTKLIEKVNNMPLNYFDKHSYGDTLSRVTNDVDTIGTSLNQSVSSLISSIVLFFGSLFLMYHTNWVMATAGILTTFLGFAFVMVIMKKSQKYFNQQQEKIGSLNGHIEEAYSGHTVVKSYNAEKEVKTEFDKINEEVYNAGWKAQFLSGLMMPIMMFVGNFAYVVVCIIGAVLATNGYIEFGVIVAFILYIRLFTQPLSNIAQGFTALQSAVAASERVEEILNEKELMNEDEKSATLEKIEKGVSFKNVKFGYSKDKIIINDFSAEVKKGQKAAIVGPTGAGKTTLVNLLMNYYELNSGEITIDDIPISNLKRQNLHELFGMVLQDTWVFEGTVFENIAFNMEDVKLDDVIDVCKMIGIHRTIMTLPKGYDSEIDATTLSIGENQLLNIARVIMKKSELIILDEATSSVDTRTEILIQEAMDKVCENKTSFIIAHRLSTIKNADIILVMKDGDIIETGNHDELLDKKGFYAELYNSQFEEA